MPFDQIVRLVADSQETLYPVIDDEGGLTGIFTLRDVRLALAARPRPARPGGRLRHAARRDGDSPNDLHTALKRLTELNLDRSPLWTRKTVTLVGLLSRRDLVAAYMAQIDALRSPPTAEPTVNRG